MKIKKFLKYLPISLMAAALTLTAIPFSYVPQNTSSSESKLNDADSMKSAVSIPVNNLKVDRTWTNDIWNETQGLYYMIPVIDTMTHIGYGSETSFRPWAGYWLFNLDETGFTVNPARPKYDVIRKVTNNFSQTSTLTIDPITINLNKYRTSAGKTFDNLFFLDQYNYADQAYTKQSLTNPMTFGNPNSPVAFTLPNVSFSPSTPFIKLTIPGYYYKMLLTYNSLAESNIPDIVVGQNDLFTSKKLYDKAAPSSSPVDTYDWGYTDPRDNNPQDYQMQSGSGNQKFQIWNYYTLTNVSVYKDYDGNVLKGTYMTKHGDSFNSVYSGISVEEDVGLDKTAFPSTQISKLNNITTIIGNDIGYSFVRQGTLTASADDKNGKISMSFMPKYGFVNGEIVPYTGAAVLKTITGFPASITNIFALQGHPTNVIVDKWKGTVANDSGLVTNRSELSKYLDLTTVPTTANIYILFNSDLSKVYNYSLGTVSFSVYASQTMYTGGLTYEGQSNTFPITLTLTPRVTKMTPIASGYPNNLNAVELKDRLFDSAGLVKDLVEFQKYVKIEAPVSNVKYYLIQNTWEPHTGDGTLTFAVYADKYYDANGIEKTGLITDFANRIDFNLKLKKDDSVMQLKANYPNTTRVDKFINSLQLDSNKVVGNTSELAKYFNLQNIPSAAKFKITNPVSSDYNDQFVRDTISFDLTATAFNKDNATNIYTENFSLKLAEQHQGTEVNVKTNYDSTLRVDKVIESLKKFQNADLMAYLTQFIDFVSVPSDSAVSIANIIGDEATGKLSFELALTKIYTVNSDPFTGVNKYSINLLLGQKHQPTSIILNANYPKEISIVEFERKLSKLTGVEIYEYLVPTFLTVASVDPIIFKAEITSLDYQTGNVKFKITQPWFYNDESDLINENISFNFEIKLVRKYYETKIVKWDSKLYPKDLTVSKFKSLIELNSVFDGGVYKLSPANILLLNNYVDFIEIPPEANTSLVWDDNTTDEAAGKIGFNLLINQYYNAEGYFITAEQKTFNINLNIAKPATIPAKTMLTSNPNSPVINSEQEFIDMVFNSKNVINRDNLSLFVAGLQTIPATAQITNIQTQTTKNSVVLCGITVSGHYDGIKTEMISESKTYEFQIKMKISDSLSSVQETTSNWWIWIIVGVAAGVLLMLVIVSYVKYRKSKELTISKF